MGCINSEGQFNHWFGNIHLSGPCNRSCYFCIGQHMQSLERLNNLDTWPLPGFSDFVTECNVKGINEVNLTGSNTDPLLYHHVDQLHLALSTFITDLKFGLRTNGALLLSRPDVVRYFDKISISVPTFDAEVYRSMMGSGSPPNVRAILQRYPDKSFKINVVLGPENSHPDWLLPFLEQLRWCGIKAVNLREPYGQPHIGDPLASVMRPAGELFGMSRYDLYGMSIVYWDVHFVEVESVNLYANGNVSTTYPVTKGYDQAEGKVIPQDQWRHSGRHFAQWHMGV